MFIPVFVDVFDKNRGLDPDQELLNINTTGVLNILQPGYTPLFHDFWTLLQPGSLNFLPQMMARSAAITRQHFGNTIQFFAPLYLSNECQNICTYCGFSLENNIPRKTLSEPEILAEAAVLKSMGFRHILLVTGEANKSVGVDYLVQAICLLRPHFDQISVEVQPLETAAYIRLKQAGVYAVLVYQETYDKQVYAQAHPKGKKSNFEFRLDTPDRLGRAGIHKIGLGVLLGLSPDWRQDAYYNARHLGYLQRAYWQTKFSVSFPRIRPHEGDFQPQCTLSEKELLQLICAFRISFPNVELSLSTRERAAFRDAVISYGITSISAGSKTEPGGYSQPDAALKQFDIDDSRSPLEIEQMIRNQNLEPVWKDWDAVLSL
jgi:2-iminoacetate synthase